MLKEFLKKFVFGLPIGVTITFIIGLCFSFSLGGNEYFPVNPEMIQAWGDENIAVLVQGVLGALLGGSFSAFSVVWDEFDWSLFLKTFVYYFVNLVVISIVGYVCYWFPRDDFGAYIGFFLIYTFIFVCFWVVMFLIEYRKVKKMNSKIID